MGHQRFPFSLGAVYNIGHQVERERYLAESRRAEDAARKAETGRPPR